MSDFDVSFQDRCLSEVTRDAAGDYVVEEMMQVIIANLPPIDIDQMQRQRAKKIHETWEKTGGTKESGQIWLPGLDPVAHEPHQILMSADGSHAIEKEHATVDHFITKQEKREENLKRQAKVVDYGRAELAHFQRWQNEQIASGRPTLDLTWGNCIRETGILREGAGKVAA